MSPTTERPVRCALGMLASDKHNKGLRMVAKLLRDQGVEVVYLGEYNTAQTIAKAVVDEDVDLVGISAFTGNYVKKMQDLMTELERVGASDVPVMLGGLIHADDEEAIYAAGVDVIFGPRKGTEDILEYIAKLKATANAR
ncbi:cobalamin-binding protein [Amycolatopsis acidicola]|uniref:Cobalamin-binding protein n=1 Tax=Amycolatopsis acidicola TaxID=2596893 RepID=A0A5N0VE71_9PSEU|nr:cobalamin-dependent protein [Amycolatopsis acidicola]KAA9164365.1 cobalamin-binding protein [Amycolatopsis acidicola]